MRIVAMFLVVALLLIVVPYASAIPVERIELLNCGFASSSPLACGQTATVQCAVNDTFTGSPAPTITGVGFQVGNSLLTGTLISGTNRQGVWSATVSPESASVNGAVTLVKALADDSSNNVGISGCIFIVSGPNQNYEATECIGSSSSVVSIPTTCSCTYTTTTSCSPKNILTKSIIPSSGCVGASVVTTTGTCDYCDSGWTSVISKCQPATGYNVTDRFLGVATKTYVTSGVAGETCRQLGQNGRGDPNDANPPPDDGTQVLCRMDAWSAGGKDASGTDHHEGGSIMRSTVFDSKNFTLSFAEGSDVTGARILKSLVFDVNQDGVQEMVLFGPSGWTVERTDGTVLQQLSLPNTLWEGQPSLWNYNYAGAQLFSYALQNGSSGAGVAGIYYNQTDGHDYFISVSFNVGTGIGLPKAYNIDTKVSCPGAACAIGSGVACADTYCWYVTNTQKPVLVDMTSSNLASGSIVYNPLSPASVYDTSASITPVLINMGSGLNGPFPPRPQVVAWFGKTNTPKMAWFACTTVGVCTYQALDSSINLANVSNVAVAQVAQPAASCVGTRSGACADYTGNQVACLNHGCNFVTEGAVCDGAQSVCSVYGDKTSCETSYCTWAQTGTASTAQLYVTTETDVNGSRNAILRSIEVVGTGVNVLSGLPLALTFQNVKSNLLSGIAGGAEKCVSEPASAKCASGYQGVALLSSWKPTSQVSITNTPWTMPQTELSQPVRQLGAPFSGLGDSSNTQLSRELCGVHNCYLISGSSQPNNMKGDYVLYWNADDGPFASLPTFGLIDVVSKTTTELNWTGCWGANTLGSHILAAGIYKDDLVLLMWTPLASPSGSSCNQVLQDIKLMRWSSSTGVWSTVYDFGALAAGNGENGNFGVYPFTPWQGMYGGATALRCGENGNSYCEWRKGFVTGTAAMFASYGEIVMNMDTNSIQHNAILKGVYFGGTLNQTMPIDYAYTTSGDDVFSVSNAVVFYNHVSPNSPSVLESSTDSSKRFYGIAQSAVDHKVYWIGVPVSGATSTSTCAATNLTADYFMNVPGMGQFYAPRSIMYTGSLPYWPYSCTGSFNYTGTDAHSCYVDIGQYTINGAVAVSADAYWSFPYHDYLTTDGNSGDAYFQYKWYAGFDSAGKYFVVYPVTLKSGEAPLVSTVYNGMHVYMVSYKDGSVLKSYFPAGAFSGYVNDTITQLLSASSCVVVNGAGGTRYATGSGLCQGYWAGDLSGTACLPQELVQGGSRTEGPPTPLQSRVIRNFDTSIGKVNIDYITGVTNASPATSDYNQLDCYAYTGPSNAGMTTDTSKQIGAAYCTKQLATGDTNGDGRDELLTPEGTFSIGGLNTVDVRFGGDITTPVSAMELVDVNQDTFTDMMQLTSSGVKGIKSLPSTRGYSNTGLMASNQLHCTYKQVEDTQCEALGNSKSDCTQTNIFYAPQIVGSKDPAAVYWNAHVYKLNTNANIAIQATLTIISPITDSLLRLLGIAGFYGVPNIPAANIDPLAWSLVQSLTGQVSEYGSYLATGAGSYMISMDVFDAQTGESAKGLWCEVDNVTLPVSQVVNRTTTPVEGCTLGAGGVDGEFNYIGDISQHGWVYSATQTNGNGYMLGNGILTLAPSTENDVVQLTHGLSCNLQTMYAQAKFRISSLDAGTGGLMLYGSVLDTGEKLPLSSYQVVVNNGGVVITAYGNAVAPQTVYQSSLDTSQWIVVDVVVDRVAKTVTTSIDNTSLSVTTDLMNSNAIGSFSGVVLTANDVNQEQYDYVRLSTSGSIFTPVSSNQVQAEGAFGYLDNCTTLSQQINDAQAANGSYGYSPKNRSAANRYPHVDEYCQALPGHSGLGCTSYGDLTNAVKYNSGCYDEAYQYCVLNVYPSVMKVKVNGTAGAVSELSSRQTGLDGATVCTAQLMVTEGVEKIGAPTLQLIWSLFLNYWYYWLLLIVIIAMISMARSRVK